jgi:hypothetical protein
MQSEKLFIIAVAVCVIVGLVSLFSGIENAMHNNTLLKLTEKSNPVAARCAMDPPSEGSTTWLELCKWSLTVDNNAFK